MSGHREIPMYKPPSSTYGSAKSYVPVHHVGLPNGGVPPPVPPISPTTPVHSAYTGKLVGYGSIPWGIPTDAPAGNKNAGKNFHGIVYNPFNRSYMIHRATYP
jgi:hypothetical protein